jgi:hypothetical protein
MGPSGDSPSGDPTSDVDEIRKGLPTGTVTLAFQLLVAESPSRAGSVLPDLLEIREPDGRY